MKEFHLSDILSVYTYRLVSPRGMDAVYELLNYMTGDELVTHQLCRAADECQPYLEEQFSFLKELPKFTDDNWKAETQAAVDKYGEMFTVLPIHSEDHQVLDPIVELALQRPHLKVYTLDLDTGDIDVPTED